MRMTNGSHNVKYNIIIMLLRKLDIAITNAYLYMPTTPKKKMAKIKSSEVYAI